ncbi:hypothetical protein GCM10025857_29430 [Alicyclobacillus contaminans]|nr:hypothetical protein GCM10025857_29430 [Alicyclobacillus contaminans]
MVMCMAMFPAMMPMRKPPCACLYLQDEYTADYDKSQQGVAALVQELDGSAVRLHCPIAGFSGLELTQET